MRNERDDWEKPRARNQHLTDQEVEFIRQKMRDGYPPKSIARDLKCSTRVVTKYFAQVRGAFAARRPKSAYRHVKPTEDLRPKQTEPERRASRFYHSTFEL